MRIRSVLKHSTMAVLEGALVASLVVGLMAGTALAGKPTGGGGHHKPGGGATGGGTVAVVLASDVDADGVISWGDWVTYTISTTATAYPYVSTSCNQGQTQVLSGSAGFFASYPWPDAQTFDLKTMLWTSGAADCTATLYSNDGGSRVNLQTITFHTNS